MVYNRFFFLCLFRVFLLIIPLIILATIALRTDLFFTQIILLGITILQVMELTRFVTQTNKEITRFVGSIKDGDFSISYGKKNSFFDPLRSTFDEIIQTFKELETSKAAQLQFLRSLVDQIEFGILVLNKSDEIEIINKHATELIQIPNVSNWKNLKSSHTHFLELISHPGFDKQVLEISIGGVKKALAIKMTPIKISDNPLRIFSFRDIKNELNQKEVDTWQRLIRILTHEVMNSVTPLASLAETSQMILREDGKLVKHDQLNDENIEDLDLAVETIRSRTKGMLHFVQQYRKLTRVPNPILKSERMDELVSRTLKLLQNNLGSVQVTLELSQETIKIDAALIEQVFINLILNGCQAMEQSSTKKLTISSTGSNIFYVSDTGPGIPMNKLDRVFVPFYSTKKDGSGIGLSLCRQIMSVHNGSIELTHSDSTGTTFELRFKN